MSRSGALGALRLQQESSPLLNSAIAYAYDALGRLASSTVTGAGAETFGYDAIGRLVSHANDLGSFALSYLGQTGQIAGRQLAGSTLATTWSYLSNTGDRRLAGIANVGLSSGQYSTYAYTTTPENFIAGIAETSDSAAVYPSTGTQTASYNNVNALTSLSGGPMSYDANGNLLADGLRTYQWDAESRLVGISYPGFPGQIGKATTFAYDGLGRRTTITSTLAGGGPRGTSGGLWWGHHYFFGGGGGGSDSGIAALTTSYLWCGARICQARNAYNAPTREYYAEGELVLGTPALPYYYGPDQLGTVRRAFASTTSAPDYGYDPYGNPLQTTAPVTDFDYAGTFYNADSGLYLTMYRAYNPAIGRWLSRDPIGEGERPYGEPLRLRRGEPDQLYRPAGFGCHNHSLCGWGRLRTYWNWRGALGSDSRTRPDARVLPGARLQPGGTSVRSSWRASAGYGTRPGAGRSKHNQDSDDGGTGRTDCELPQKPQVETQQLLHDRCRECT